jgi:hypothetical protein
LHNILRNFRLFFIVFIKNALRVKGRAGRISAVPPAFALDFPTPLFALTRRIRSSLPPKTGSKRQLQSEMEISCFYLSFSHGEVLFEKRLETPAFSQLLFLKL